MNARSGPGTNILLSARGLGQSTRVTGRNADGITQIEYPRRWHWLGFCRVGQINGSPEAVEIAQAPPPPPPPHPNSCTPGASAARTGEQASIYPNRLAYPATKRCSLQGPDQRRTG
jgi:hypothetical protein